ncbi:MAG: DUF2164 family protein, partial [Xanthomonas sp.]
MSAPARTAVLGREDKRAIAEQLQAYLRTDLLLQLGAQVGLRTELQQQVGAFEAEFLLDFVAERIGPHYYNRGLHDARAALAAQ